MALKCEGQNANRSKFKEEFLVDLKVIKLIKKILDRLISLKFIEIIYLRDLRMKREKREIVRIRAGKSISRRRAGESRCMQTCQSEHCFSISLKLVSYLKSIIELEILCLK